MRERLSRSLPYLLVPAAFATFVLLVMPVRQTFQFNKDEGFNLMKAVLFSDGIPLYARIWSDQPPLLTVLMSHWLAWFGASIFAARILILIFAALLVGLFHRILDRSLGGWPALAGLFFLVASSKFVELSVSVMIGMVALSLAMLAIELLLLDGKSRSAVLALASGSGVLMALSLQTKLFSLFLVPLMAPFLLPRRDRHEDRLAPRRHDDDQGPARPLLVWGGSMAGVYLLIGVLCRSLSYDQLVRSHLGQGVREAFPHDGAKVLEMFIQDIPLVIAGVLGLCAALASRRGWQARFPVAWLASASLILSLHRPLWYHHYLLISIPLAWLAAQGVAFAMQAGKADRYGRGIEAGVAVVPGRERPAREIEAGVAVVPGRERPATRGIGTRVAMTVLSLCVLMAPVRLTALSVRAARRASEEPPRSDCEIVNALSQHAASTRWVFTDLPIYPFYAGLRVPPEMAVPSAKRFFSGNLKGDELLRILKEYRPEQLVLGEKFQSLEGPFRLYVAEHYEMTLDTGDAAHYLAREPPGTPVSTR